MRLAVAAALLAASPAAGWISLTQSRFGTSLHLLKNESVGVGTGTAQQSLGYLWSLPELSHDSRGLGGSITWAWDPELCAQLEPAFYQDFWQFSFISCHTIKASLQRAFQTWSMNHRYISFTDVTDLCLKDNQMHEGCEYAELWITSKNSTAGRASLVGGNAAPVEPTLAVGKSRKTTTFRNTNGE